MLILGLTGGIATGKSTVSSLLSHPPYDLPIIDADLLARKVVEPGTPGYQKIVTYFSPSTPDLLQSASEEEGSDGTEHGPPLNRPALGRRVFGDTPDRRRDRAVLNSIVHPAVRREVFKALLYHYVRGHWAVVLDVPLLFESGMDRLCGTVMVVGCDATTQMQRLRARDAHLTEEDARNRIGSQADVREKAARAEAQGGVVIWNDGSREELRASLHQAMEEIQRRSPQWWAWFLLLCPPAAMAAALLHWTAARTRWLEEEKSERAKL
ncbi:MAG: hypothetical protein M1817_000747 [Caeruleum heppii]|nr:MAG: hypothetical protein M1817_000747 [Caeruleum heppii]